MNVLIVGGSGAVGRMCQVYLAHHIVYVPPADEMDIEVQFEVAQYVRKHGAEMDALVYAAGVNYLEWSDEIDTMEMMHVFNVNVVGLARVLRVVPNVKRVVVIGSDAARRPMRTSLAYNASKAALEAAVKVIARERAADGLVINVVAPGLLDNSDMTEYVFRRTRELRPELDLADYMLGGIPMGRAGRPVEIAQVVKWLIDDAPEYLNGTVIDVNGAR